jgi:hypothetical protein
MKRKAWVVGAIAVATTIGVAPAWAGQQTPHGDLSGKSTCTPLKELPAQHIDAQGNAVKANTAGAGLVRRFVLHGTVIRETVPPANWNAQTAPADQLARFGLPPRPHSAAALAAWSKQVAAPRTTSTMCASTTSAAATQLTQNWSGVVNTGNKNQMWEASAAFVQPHFTTGCQYASAHTLFAGLGGWIGSPGLIEAGTDTFQNKVDGAQGFWEMGDNINKTDTNEIRLPDFVLHGGELATVSVEVASNPQTGNLAAYFHLGVAVGTGPAVDIGPIETMPGTDTPIADIYDGTSADYIDERPLNKTLPNPVDGQFFYLRQSVDAQGNPAKTMWFPATNGGEPGLSDTLAVMQRHNGTLLEDPAERLGGFDNTWHACA